MRLAINLGLIAIIGLLVWMLFSSIQEPIAFKAAKELRNAAVVDRLQKIRSAQEIYREITGKFAGDFDTLVNTLKTGKVQIISVYGNPDDPDSDGSDIRFDTTYVSALEKVEEKEIGSLDSLRYVPFGGSVQFDIQADTITYQSTLVNVVEVGTPIKTYMGKYKDPAYGRYDAGYDPDNVIKFGNMNAPNLSGNWER
ncbi:MAG: hypothetical protein AAF990_08985 [Bacteroidota bacterium]